MMYPTLNVVDKAVEQVQDKMEYLENKADSFIWQLKGSLDDLANMAIGEVQDAPTLSYENNLPPGYELLTPPDFILPLVTPPVLDFGEAQAITAPEPIKVPEITFSVDIPVLPALLEPPMLEELDLADPSVDIETLTLPEIPEQVFEVGMDMPVPIDLSQILSDLDLSGLELPEAPIAIIPNEIAEPSLLELIKPEKPEPESIEYPELTEFELPELPEFTSEIEIPEFDFSEFETLTEDITKTNDDTKKDAEEFTEQYLTDLQETLEAINDDREKYREKFMEEYEEMEEDKLAETNWFFGTLAAWREGKVAPWDKMTQQAVIQSVDVVFDRENRVTQREVQAVYQDWAARGFSMPQGAMARRVDAIRTQGNLRASEASRPLVIEAFKEKIREIHLFMDKCFQMEQVVYDRFMQKKKHELDVIQMKLDMEKMRYDDQKAMFQIRMDAAKFFIDIYKYIIEATFKKMDIFRFQMEVLDFDLRIRQNLMDLFKLKFEAAMSHVEKYKALMDTVKVKVDVIKTQFEMYKTEIDGFSAESGIEKLKVDMYGTKVQAENNRLGLFETMARNYAASIQGLSAKADVVNKQQDLKVEAAKIDLQRYQSDLDRYKTILQQQSTTNADLTSNYVRRLEAFKAAVGTQLGVIETKSKYDQVRANIKVANADMRSKYADMNARVGMANADLQGKFIDIQSRTQLANLDAQVKHADMLTRVGISNAEIQARTAETNSRMYAAKADVQTKYADMQTRTNIASADMQSKYIEVQSRVGMANSEIQTRFAELNSKVGISNNELRLKQYDTQISKMFQKTQLAIEAEKAIAQYSAQLAAGAMSAMHVSAGISGSGSSSVGYSASEGRTESHNYSY